MDRDVDQLVKEGHALAAPDAEALERRLEEEPYDLDARARLLGYYGHHCRLQLTGARPSPSTIGWSFPPCEARFRHALWVIAHAPDAPLAAHPLMRIPRSNRGYYEAAELWQQHVAADAVAATLLDHALRFFEGENHVRVEELLERAELAYPGDARWAKRRRSMRIDELGCTWIKYRIGEVTGKELSGPGELVEIEALLGEGDLEPPLAVQLHEAAARMLLHFAHLAKARVHAEAMVAVGAGVRDGVDGPQVHSGHVLLGRIALREGDVGEARARLGLAGRTAGTTLSNPPEMALANELLAHGERDAVLQYLLLCRAACDSYGAVLEKWIAELRDGLIPELLGFPFID